MAWWKRGKCDLCKTKFKKNADKHELTINAQDGVVTLKICDSCAEFWDKSAEVLKR